MEAIFVFLMAVFQTGSLGDWVTTTQGVLWGLSMLRLLASSAWDKIWAQRTTRPPVIPVPNLELAMVPPGAVIVVVPAGANVTVTVRSA